MIPPAVNILFGALFTVATAIAIGRLLLRRAGVDLYREEQDLLGFIAGSAVLSLIVFLLSTVGLARKGVFLVIGTLAIAAALRFRNEVRPSFAPLPRLWKWFFAAAFAAFTVYYLITAMEPEYSADAVAYHLNFVNRYNRAHGFVRISNMYASLSQGIELLYLFAFAFGRHSSAALVHFAFLIVLSLSILSYARRAGYPIAGICAALLIYACPIDGMDGTSGYIDVAVAGVVFAVFYLTQIWDGERKTALLILIGLVAGFAYAAKYTAFLAIPYAAGFVLWRRRSWKQAAIVVLCALILIVPWVAKDILWTGNPVSPMLNRVFPNHTVHPSFEASLTRQLSIYSLKSRWQIPLEVTVRGQELGGLIGPVFLLVPLALLGLGQPVVRRLLFAGTLFFLPYFLNIGARFLIPVLPFFALALAIALSRFPVLLAAVVVFHCVASWPPLVGKYSAPYAWRMNRVSWRAALRVQSEDSYLAWDDNYGIVRSMERRVPAGARIFSLSGQQEAYSTKTFLSAWLSAESELLLDIFQCAAFPDYKPAWIRTYRFEPRQLGKLRLVETARALRDESWSIAEVHLESGGQELQRTPAWRLTAKPNPWDIGMAFDNNLVTRWRSWQEYEPGMFIEVDFGKVQSIDTVRIEIPTDQGGAVMRIEGLDGRGRWQTIPATMAQTDLPDVGFLGARAMAEIQSRNIQYFFLRTGDYGAKAVLKDPAAWNLTLVDQFADGRLYHIDAPSSSLEK